MSRTVQIVIHSIKEDGLPDMEALTGRVAFIFDGSIVSGWPLGAGVDADEGYIGMWEGDSDVARAGRFAAVTHWVEFPAPIWELERDTPE